MFPESVDAGAVLSFRPRCLLVVVVVLISVVVVVLAVVGFMVVMVAMVLNHCLGIHVGIMAAARVYDRVACYEDSPTVSLPALILTWSPNSLIWQKPLEDLKECLKESPNGALKGTPKLYTGLLLEGLVIISNLLECRLLTLRKSG